MRLKYYIKLCYIKLYKKYIVCIVSSEKKIFSKSKLNCAFNPNKFAVITLFMKTNLI